MTIKINRGTNISHWLSQSPRRGSERREFFTQADVQRIAAWGFDHIRLPIDEEQMWDETGSKNAEAFDLLDAALNWCEQAGLKTVVDLHILRSHHFNAADKASLFTDPAQAEHLAGLWRELSGHLSGRSLDIVAYELLNEAVAPTDDDWNRVSAIAYKAVRDLEPKRSIVLGSNCFNSADTYDNLNIPDDPETILTFHYYRPMLVTHYRAQWCKQTKDYAGPVQYPGRPIADVDSVDIPQPVRADLDKLNLPYDRQQMQTDLAQPLAAAKRKGLSLYCGEFGVFSECPTPARMAWYKDFISVLTENKIAWSNWDYKGSFGIIDKEGNSTGIAEILLGE